MKQTKKIVLYIVWACMYVLCVGLGTLPAEGFGVAALALVGAAFFVPGFWLAAIALKEKDRKLLRLLRIISICSLSLTLLALVGNFLTVQASAEVGAVMFDVLALVSAPMLCIQYWLVSLFLWACLLMISIPGVVLPGEKKA